MDHIHRLLEEGQAFVECFGTNGGCTIDGRCALKVRLRRAEAAFLAEFDRSTLADIALPTLRNGGDGLRGDPAG